MNGNQNYNPDVLNCLANLSNDEVFTPPELANKMLDLLPQDLFQNSNTTFLDPFTKSGVFLREIVKRLDVGIADKIPDRQQRIDHILHHQVFGIAITELTSLLARRSVYCSKDASGKYSISKFPTSSGNIIYKNIKHTWVNGKCKYCGASQTVYDRGSEAEQYAYMFIHTDNPKQFFPNMKFDVIVGNPPYQLNDGGGSNGISAKPIYHLFIQQAKKLNVQYLSVIIPSRWFAGGKGLLEFRNEMMKDDSLKYMVNYPKSRECFAGVDIAGGVCYFLRDKSYHGSCEFKEIKGDTSTIRHRYLNEFDVLISDNMGVDIIYKVRDLTTENYSDRVLPRNSFGFTSSSRGQNEPFKGAISLISSEGTTYVSQSDVTRNNDLVDKYKISVGTLNPDRGGVNNAKDGMMNVTTKVRILKPNEVVTETYIVIDTFDTEEEANNCATYFKTKFARYLIALTLSSMHIVKMNYQFVPLQDFSHPWTDEMLYKKYGLTDEEIAFIESIIRPME